MDRQKQLLQYLQSQGYYKDYDEAKFASKLNDPNWAGALYNGMRQNGLMSDKFESFDSFADDLGIKKKTQPGAGSGVGSQEVSLTPPQVEAPAPPSPQAPGPQPATTPPMGVPTQEQVSREQLARQRQIAEQTPLVLSPERYKQAEQERAQPAELGQIEQDFPIKSPQSGVADLQRARSERMTGVQRPAPSKVETPTVTQPQPGIQRPQAPRVNVPIYSKSGDITGFINTKDFSKEYDVSQQEGRKSLLSQMAGGLWAGTKELAANIAEIPEYVQDVATDIFTDISMALMGKDERAKAEQDRESVKNKARNVIRKLPADLLIPGIGGIFRNQLQSDQETKLDKWADEQRENAKAVQQSFENADQTIESLYKEGRYIDALRRGGALLSLSLPNTIAAIATTKGLGGGAVGAAGSLGIISTAAGKSKYEQLEEEFGEGKLTSKEAVNSVLTGLVEGASEIIPAKIGQQAIDLALRFGVDFAKETVETGVKTFFRQLVTSTPENVISEVAAQIGENVIDKATINPDKNIFEGIFDAAALGFGSSAGMLTTGAAAGALAGGTSRTVGAMMGNIPISQEAANNINSAARIAALFHDVSYGEENRTRESVSRIVDEYIADLPENISDKSEGKISVEQARNSQEYYDVTNNREDIIRAILEKKKPAETFSQLSEAEQAFSSYLDTIESQGTKVRTDEDIQNALTNFYQANPDAAKEESRLLMVGRAFASQKQEQDATQKVENLQPQGGELQPVGTEEGQQVQGTGQEAQPGTDASDLAAVGGMQAGQVTEQTPVDGAEQPTATQPKPVGATPTTPTATQPEPVGATPTIPQPEPTAGMPATDLIQDRGIFTVVSDGFRGFDDADEGNTKIKKSGAGVSTDFRGGRFAINNMPQVDGAYNSPSKPILYLAKLPNSDKTYLVAAVGQLSSGERNGRDGTVFGSIEYKEGMGNDVKRALLQETYNRYLKNDGGRGFLKRYGDTIVNTNTPVYDPNMPLSDIDLTGTYQPDAFEGATPTAPTAAQPKPVGATTAAPTAAPEPTGITPEPTPTAPTAAPEPTGVTPTEPSVTPTAAPAAPAKPKSPYAITGKRRETIQSPIDRRKKIPIYDSAQTTVDELLNEFEKQGERRWIDEKKFRQIHERVLTVSRVLSRFGIKIYFTAKMEKSTKVAKGIYFDEILADGSPYIVISAKDATVSTVVHEAFHAIIRTGKLSPNELVYSLYKPISDILKNNPDTVATYNKIQDWLKGAKYRRDEVPEEFLAQLSGYISDGIGKKPLNKSSIAKLESVINNVLEKLLGKDVLVVRFTNTADVIDFFNTLTDGLTAGDTTQVERALELYESGRVTNPRKTIYFKGTEIPNGRLFVRNTLKTLDRITDADTINGIQNLVNKTLKLIPGLDKTSVTIDTGKDARNLIVEMSDKNTIQGKKIGATAKKIQDAIADIVLAINDYLASRGNDPQLEEYKLDPIDGQDTVQSDINAEMMPEEVRNPDKTQFNKQQEMVKSIQEAISNLDRERQKIAFAIRNKAKFISEKTKANTVSSSMRVAGISPVVSELLTGITSDVVGNPRIAIGARTAKIKKIIARGESGPLSSFLSFPDMYDLIPQLTDYTVLHDETVGDVQATIDLDAKTIRVGNMNVGNTEQDFFIALMNEVRYAAQDFELFEAGVTPEGSLDAQEMFAAMRTQINMRVKELQDRLNRDKKEGYSPAFIADSQAELNQAMEQAAKINAIGDRNSYFNYVRSIPTNSLTDINGRILTYSEIQNQIDANESRKQHYISLFNNITDEGQTITHVKSDEINLYAKQVDDGTHIIEVRVKNGNEGFYSPKSLQFKGIPTREEMFRKIGEILPTLKNILSRQYDKQIAFYKKAQLLAPGTAPSAQIIGSAGGFKSESDPEYWRYMYTRNSMPNSADFISMDIPGISNKYQPSDTHVFHGTNTYEINQNGDLVLKPSKNFEGKTVSISTTPIPVVAQDYMLRKQGNIIIKINRQALRGKGEVVSADEIAINTTEPFIIPSDQFEIINVKSLKDKKREEYDYTANSVSDKILSSESDIIALSKAFGSFINAQNEEEIELDERKSESGTKPAWYKSTVEIQELAGNKIYDRLKDKINKQFIIDGIAEEAIRQIEFKGPVLYAGNKKEDAVAEYLHDLDTYGDTSSPFASDLFSELLNVIGIYDAPIHPGEKQRDEYLAIVKAIIDKVESAGVTIAIKNELTYTYISPDDLASMDPSDRTNILADQMDFDGTTEELLFEVADTEQFASQDSMVKSRKVFDQTKFISVANAMQRLATVNPDYLRPVLNSIREMRKRTRNGELQPSDVAKAWMMSVASQQAGPVDAATASKHLASKGINVVLDESVFAESYSVKNRKTKETVIKQGGIRPEAMAAMMLSSSMGRKFLSDLNKGNVDTGFIDKFIDAISLYGMQNKKRESIIGTGEKKGIYQIGEVTQRLNEIGKKGPEANEEFYKELMTLGMIKEGKTGFMGQFLGISDRGVIDSRQLDFWIENGGDGEKKISDKASAELIAKISMVAKRLGFAEEDAYIAHHLIWDKVGGIEVVHQSMYELMMDYNLQDEQNMMFEMAENSVPDTLSSSIKSNPNFRPAVRLIDTYLNDDTQMTPYSTDHELARALIMQFGFSPYEARQLIEHRAGRRYRAAHPMTVDADASYEAMIHYFKQASVWSKEGREKWKQFAYSLDLWVGNYLTGVRTLMNQLTKQAGAGTTPSELNAYAALQNMRGKSAFRIMNYRDKFIGDPESVSSKRDSFIGRLSSALGKGATEMFNKFMIAQHQEERYDRLIAKQLKKISEMMRVMAERDLEAQEKQDAINALSSIMAASSDPAAVEGQMKRLEAEIEKLSKKNESVRNILETQKELLDQLEQRKMSAIEFREKVFDEMTPEQLAKAREFYAEFKRDYVDEFVNVLLDGGIISQERADYLLNGTTEDDPVGWQFYVPLLIEESAYADEYGEFQSPMDGAPNGKSYATIANPGIQRLRGAVAFGEQDIQNILHVVFDKLTRATILAEQNLARQTMADMLQQYPSQTLYVDSKGNEHPRYQVISSRARPVVNEFGEVVGVDDYTPEVVKKQSIQFIDKDGKMKYMFFANTNDPVLLGARAKPSEFSAMGKGIIKGLNILNNVFRPLITQFSPTFIIQNPFRDVQEALISIDTEGKQIRPTSRKLKRSLLKNYFKAIAFFAGNTWLAKAMGVDNKTSKSAWRRQMYDMWMEVQQEGGRMSWAMLGTNPTESMESLQKSMLDAELAATANPSNEQVESWMQGVQSDIAAKQAEIDAIIAASTTTTTTAATTGTTTALSAEDKAKVANLTAQKKALELKLKAIDKTVNATGQVVYRVKNPKFLIKDAFLQLSKLSDFTENLSRLAAHTTVREAGGSPREGAMVARNITINFEKRGLSDALRAGNAGWLFLNVGIQGARRFGKLLANPEGRKAMLTLIILSAANRALFHAFTDDEEEEYNKKKYIYSDYIGRNKTLVHNPFNPNAPIMIPKAYGLSRLAYTLGEGMVDMAYELKSPGDIAIDATMDILTAVDPIGGGSSAPVNYLPVAALSPLFQALFNQDYMGNEILRSYGFSSSLMPNYQKKYKTTEEWAVKFAEAMYNIPIGPDVSPITIEFLAKEYGGLGPARFLQNINDMAKLAEENGEQLGIDKVLLSTIKPLYREDISEKAAYDMYILLDVVRQSGARSAITGIPEGKKKFMKDALDHVRQKELMKPQQIVQMKKALRARYPDETEFIDGL